MPYTDEKEKMRISQEYLKIIEQYGLKKVFRIIDEKTFVSSHDFRARYRDLYSTEEGKFSVVWKFDPEPGGYGEEFVLIEGMTEPVGIENSDALSEEELLENAAKRGKRIDLAGMCNDIGGRLW